MCLINHFELAVSTDPHVLEPHECPQDIGVLQVMLAQEVELKHPKLTPEFSATEPGSLRF